MSEWWTYTLSSFLLFSAQTYYRLFELYNRAIWPAQFVALTLGIVILACLLCAIPGRGYVVTTVLAACWLWVAWAFHAGYYATINWAANYFAIGFTAEALLLIRTRLVLGRLRLTPAGDAVHFAGLCVFLFALTIHPLIGPAMGRPWPQVEIFGVTPDSTAIATLGILLLGPNRPLWTPMLIPLIWCAVSGATLWTMKSQDALIMPFTVALVLLLAIRKTLSIRPD